MNKHTPTPWEYHPKLTASENHKGFALVDSNKHWIADISPRDAEGIEGLANADFICKAVNCHNDLLATLSIIVEEIRRANGWPHFSEEQMTLLAESIAKARQQ